MTILLAKIIGIMLITVGIAFVKKTINIKNIILDFGRNSALIYIGGFVSLLLGLIVVLNHNIWESGPEVIISLLGWAALIKGIVLIIAPQEYMKFALGLIKNKTYDILIPILLIIGVYLTLFGFGAI